MKQNKTTIIGLALIPVIALSGCSAVTTAVKKRNLEVQTQMSETIWLDPVGADKRTVFVQVRNTTDKPIDIMDALSTKLSKKGYRVVKDPDAAHYWVQTNILKLDKMDLREAQGFLSSGYGAVIYGSTVGALATEALTSHNNTPRVTFFPTGENTLTTGALIGAAVGLVADAMVEDVNYAMITDVQIVEKTDQQLQTKEQANIKNGSSISTKTTLTSLDNKKRFQTRIISNANKLNLEFEEAKPTLVDGLTTSISGVF